jgi:hypothetical protein
MNLLPHFLEREPKSLKGIRERSAYSPSHELSMADFREVVKPISRERAIAALERSRARRAANGVE